MLGLHFKKVCSTLVHKLKKIVVILSYILLYYQNGEATTPTNDAVPPTPPTPPPQRRRAISQIDGDMESVRRELNFSECSEVSAY